MCGIAGILDLKGEEVSQDLIKKITQRLAHRGPDSEGFFTEHNIGLGHQRLSILDTSEKGAQPMHSADGDWVITFNGFIYNFKKLRDELQQSGYDFKSTSDTEVIVAGLMYEGAAYFEKLDGMFAVGAWHRSTKTLYLSRDRFGIKPLYYWFNGRYLVFASEIKAIMQHPAFKMDLNRAALSEYFTFQNLFTYQTLFKDVTMLPPSNTVSIKKGDKDVKHHSWWDYDFSEPDESMSFQDAKDETKRLLQKAVDQQVVADVPVGSYLSGGMDSGSITALAGKTINRLKTFTAGFELSGVSGNEARYDERMEAELMANYFKTEHYQQVINAGDVSWSIPRVVWHLEDLRVGMSYQHYYISRLASKFVKVCLQGTGGDELFGGYPWRYYRVFKSLDQAHFFENYYEFWQRLVSDKDKPDLLQPKVLKEVDLAEPRRVFERVFTFNDKLSYDTPEQHIQNSLYFEIKTFLPGLLLVGDKLSMANGLEERFPFLDNELVEHAMKIPVRHKLGNLEDMKFKIDENTPHKKRLNYQEYDDGKNVLRSAMKEILPEEIVNRKKQGFSAPDESWYRDQNAEYVKALLLNKDAAYKEFLQPAYVERILSEHMDKGINHRLLIWSLLNFEWWCKLFLNNETIE